MFKRINEEEIPASAMLLSGKRKLTTVCCCDFDKDDYFHHRFMPVNYLNFAIF